MTKLNELDSQPHLDKKDWMEETLKELEQDKEALIDVLDSSCTPKQKKSISSRYQKLKHRLIIELKILRWSIIKVLYKNRLIKERFMILASLVEEENTLYRYRAFRIKKKQTASFWTK
jgi:hypothetical protein